MRPFEKQEDITQHLLYKRWLIPITNVCNLSCGGCAQLCGHFEKEKLWFLSLDDLRDVLNLLVKYTSEDKRWNEITIFGGEPTLHPKFEEILLLLYSYDSVQFRINTNGRKGHQQYYRHRNVQYFVDEHPFDQEFIPTLIASYDLLKNHNSLFYWEKAQKDCHVWANEGAMIYKNKAYFCENAASMDWFFHNGENGWEITEKTLLKGLKKRSINRLCYFAIDVLGVVQIEFLDKKFLNQVKFPPIICNS